MFFDKTENGILSVEGMHCNHCKAKVENALKELKGVKKAEADLASAEVAVTYLPNKISCAEMVDKINSIGFKASVK